MSAVKIIDVIRCSSEDPQYPARNLLKNTGKKWLSSKCNKDQSIEVEFQLNKAVIISFIDLGNYGSQTATILVSHSMRSSEDFICLLPTFTFMSVPECKQRVNRTKVEMFKQEDMMANARDESWDRIKVVCRQTYGNEQQFGLSFIGIKTSTNINTSLDIIKQSDKNNNQNQHKLKNFFGMLGESPGRPSLKANLNSSREFSLKHTPTTPRSIPTTSRDTHISPHHGSKENGFLTPTQKTPKRIFTPAARKQFAEEVDCFLEDIKFGEMLKDKKVKKVSDLRVQIEKQRGSALSRQEKNMFMEIITEKLNEHKRTTIINSKQDTSITNSLSTSQIDEIGHVECQNCHISLPASIIAIHADICKKDEQKSKKRKNRNTLCYDLGTSSDEDEQSTVSKRKKIFATKQSKSPFRLSQQAVKPPIFPSSEPISFSSPVAGINKSSNSYSIKSTTPSSRNTFSTSRTPNFSVRQKTSPVMYGAPTKTPVSTSSPWLSSVPSNSIGKDWVAKQNVTLPICIDATDNDITTSPITPQRGVTTGSYSRGSGIRRGRGKTSGSFSVGRRIRIPSSNGDDELQIAVTSSEHSYSTQVSQNNFISSTNQNGTGSGIKLTNQNGTGSGIKPTNQNRTGSGIRPTNQNGTVNGLSISTGKNASWKKTGRGRGNKKKPSDITMEIAKNIAIRNINQINATDNYTPNSNDWSDPKSGITVGSLYSAKKDVGPRNLTDNQDTQQCPICSDYIPKYKIGIHASLCDGPAKNLASTKPSSHISANNKRESSEVTNVVLTECPICSVLMDSELINIHVNHCLDSVS